jgi:hypothetical protein
MGTSKNLTENFGFSPCLPTPAQTRDAGLNRQRCHKESEAKEGEMPPPFYVMPHTEGKFSESENRLLLKGLLATFGQKADKDKEE